MSDDAAETPGRDATDADGEADGARGEADPDRETDGANVGTDGHGSGGETGADEVTEATGEAEAAAGADGEPVDAGGDANLVARVAALDGDLASEVADLRDDLESTEERVADLESRLRRKAADFENYKKRAERRREEMEARATEDLVERLVGVRDDLLRALDQDEDVEVRDGVASTLDEFDRILAAENVESVEPDPGEETDPHRHEVMMRVESDRPEGTVVDVYRPGYVMADRVLQTAQVTVSEGPDDDPDGDGADE